MEGLLADNLSAESVHQPLQVGIVDRNPAAVIEVRDIHKSFHHGASDEPILKGISFDVRPGEFVIITGSSGSGKSTLLNIISGLEAPTKGNLYIKGQDFYAQTPDERARFRATRLGIVYQQAHWVQSLNVVQNVALPLISVGVGRREAEKKALAALETLNMGRFAQNNPMELSGGEQQRVGLARAIIHDPWLIIADEPTGSLDTRNSDIVMNIFQKMNLEDKRTVLLVTHNPIYTMYANHSIEIRDGLMIKSERTE